MPKADRLRSRDQSWLWARPGKVELNLGIGQRFVVIEALSDVTAELLQPVSYFDGFDAFCNTERKRTQEQQKLLVSEMQHRIKNSLATIQAIASQNLFGKRVAARR